MEEADGKWVRLIEDEDILSEILKRLPIKTLGRFQCVSKSWKSLLSSSSFIKLHHSFTRSATPPNLLPFFQIINFRTSERSTYALHRRPQESDHQQPAHDDSQFVQHTLHFPFRFSSAPSDYPRRCSTILSHSLVDVVCGVVCVSVQTDRAAFDSFILWNPTIRKYADLPLPLLPPAIDTPRFYEARSDCCAIGFGYASSRNDFNVVRIWIPEPDMANSFQPMYQVYSTQESRWTTSMTIASVELGSCYLNTDVSQECQTSCFVNGRIHWLLSSDVDTYLVLMFDCERHEFKTMELPQEVLVCPSYCHVAGVEILEYGGMLCVYLYVFSSPYDGYVVLWAMEEYGVASSWKEMCKIPSRDELVLEDVDVYQPSFVKMASCGPSQWINIHPYDRVLSCRVYEESLFFMDYNNAQSYAMDETVDKIIPCL